MRAVATVIAGALAALALLVLLRLAGVNTGPVATAVAEIIGGTPTAAAPAQLPTAREGATAAPAQPTAAPPAPAPAAPAPVEPPPPPPTNTPATLAPVAVTLDPPVRVGQTPDPATWTWEVAAARGFSGERTGAREGDACQLTLYHSEMTGPATVWAACAQVGG